MKNKKTDDSPTERIDVLSRIIIALVVGMILGVVVSQLGLESLQGQVQNLIFVFIWLILITGVFSFWVVQNKVRLLKRIFGVADTDLSELNKTAQALLFNVVEKEYDLAERNLSILFRKLTAWYSWMNFRRWVIIVFQSLLVGFGGLLGAILLYNQNKLLSQQNELLNQQNTRLDQQTYLQEAERRSSLIFLMSNILDNMDVELKEDLGVPGVRDLSPQLIGRIIALSNSLRPYRYLSGDSLVGREISPERGFLLLSIVSSEIDNRSLRRIYKSADFSFADLKNAVLSGEFLGSINLTAANLDGALLDEADLSGANLSDAELNEAVLARANLREARLRNSKLNKAIIESANLSRANLSGADLRRATLISADLQSANFSNANLSGADISSALLRRAGFERTILDSTKVADFNWQAQIEGMGADSLRGTNYLISKYYVDSVQTKLGWYYMLLQKKNEK